MQTIAELLAQELGASPVHVQNVIDLLDQGNTIPFIARYRKELHGSMDDTALRKLEDRLNYLRNLDQRRQEVKSAIEGQEKLTPELAAAIDSARTLAEVEDLYRPYKQKRRTRATVAREKGLAPLAGLLLEALGHIPHEGERVRIQGWRMKIVKMDGNRIDEVLVRPGDAVKSGDPLVRYHLQDEAERVLQREVTTGAATESLRGQILDLERELVQTRAERNRASQLAASGLGSRQALGRLEENVRSLQHRIELTQLSIKKSEESFRARLKELEGYYGQPIREGEMLPDQLVLTSPIDGYALQLMPNLNPDVLLPAQATPVTVGQLDPVLIQVPVYEGDLGRIKEGGHARVEIPSLGDKVFSATITEISWISTNMDVAQPSYYTVELTVPNSQLELKPGFKALVRFGAAE